MVEKTRHAGLETCVPKLGLPTAGGEACATTLECRCVSRRMVARLQRLMAIMASTPRALPWAVLWRPFRPWIRTAMLEEESHGFSIDGTAQGLRYGRRGSLRYKGLPWFCRFHYEISGLERPWIAPIAPCRMDFKLSLRPDCGTIPAADGAFPKPQVADQPLPSVIPKPTLLRVWPGRKDCIIN